MIQEKPKTLRDLFGKKFGRLRKLILLSVPDDREKERSNTLLKNIFYSATNGQRKCFRRDNPIVQGNFFEASFETS